MKKKIESFRGFSRYVGFYSLIYAIVLLFFGIFGVIVVILEITDENVFPTFDILLSQLILIISFILSGSILVITYYGLSNSKTYARVMGMLGCAVILLGIIIASLLVRASFALETFVIIFIPSAVLILLLAIFWKRLKFDSV